MVILIKRFIINDAASELNYFNERRIQAIFAKRFWMKGSVINFSDSLWWFLKIIRNMGGVG